MRTLAVLGALLAVGSAAAGAVLLDGDRLHAGLADQAERPADAGGRAEHRALPAPREPHGTREHGRSRDGTARPSPEPPPPELRVRDRPECHVPDSFDVPGCSYVP